MVTDVPGGPIVGEKLVIVGAPDPEVTVKFTALDTGLPVVATEIRPVVAPLGTVVTIFVAVEETTVAAVPLKVTVLLPGVVLKAVP